MSSDMFVQIHFREAPPVNEMFCAIARVLAGWEPFRGAFTYFDVDREDIGNEVLSHHDAELPIDELCRLASGMGDPALLLSTGTTFKAWRLSPEMSGHEHKRLSLYALGNGWLKCNYADPRLYGQAHLAITPGPLTKWERDPSTPHIDEVNRQVTENLEAMIEPLLLKLADTIKPTSMIVHHENCFPIPLNAHFAYYRDAQAVIDDLRFIQELWEHGLPRYKTGPLKNRNPDDMRFTLQYMRGKEEGNRVWEELNALLPMKVQPTWADVERVLKSGKYDNFILPEGFAVLHYPYFMNAFMDGFYLDVLKEAANR